MKNTFVAGADIGEGQIVAIDEDEHVFPVSTLRGCHQFPFNKSKLMSEGIVDYRLERGETLYQFENGIKSTLKAGWELYGFPFVGKSGGVELLHQAMVRKGEVSGSLKHRVKNLINTSEAIVAEYDKDDDECDLSAIGALINLLRSELSMIDVGELK